MRTITPAALAAALALAAAAAPAHAQVPGDDVDPAIADGRAQQRLDAAHDTWRAAGVRSYRYRARHLCFCGPDVTDPARIVVRDRRPVDPPRRLRKMATVTRLFRLVQGAIDDRVADLQVRYDERGVPRRIFVNSLLQLADEEETYVVRRFRPLED